MSDDTRLAGWQDFLKHCREAASHAKPILTSGHLTRINGLVMEAAGLKLPLGSSCLILPSGGSPIEAEVVGFDSFEALQAADPASVRQSLAKRFDVGYVDSVGPEDIKVERSGDGNVISIDYEVRRPLLYNLDVVGKFSAKEEKRRGGD